MVKEKGDVSTLVVGEVALSLVLLAGAGLLMRSLVKLQSIDPGFRSEGVLTARVQLPAARYDFPKANRLSGESLARIAALPGVEDLAGTRCVPLAGPCIGTGFDRRPAEAFGASALRPGPADHIGIFQDDGDSPSGWT